MLKLENGKGSIIVDDNVISNIVSIVANNCFGITGMTAKNVTEEFWTLLKKDNLDKGIHIHCDENEITIDLHIMVIYGINIPAITESIIHKVSYSVEETTGFRVKQINLFVDEISTK